MANFKQALRMGLEGVNWRDKGAENGVAADP